MILVLKAFIVLYVTSLACHGYHHYNSKTDYANSKWRSRHALSKSYNGKWNNNHNNYNIHNNKNNYRPATTENPHRIRHGGYSASRFSHLDGFMNRLDRFKYGTVATTSTTKKPKWDSYRTNSGSVESLWGESYDDTDYDDDELEDSLTDINDEEKLNNNDEDTDYNDDDLDDSKRDIQAEEATGTNESPFTATKWERYGTMDKVQQSRKKHMQSTSGVENLLAIEHFKKVTKAAECSTPVAKVLSIQKIYPTPGKTYMPHCTILHRCSEDTGCCHDPTKQCGPKNQTIVHLYFYVQYQGVTKAERLAFANHTACGCIDKSRLNSTKFSIDDLNAIDPPMNLMASPPEHLRRCKCPAEYVPNYGYNQCNCVCAEGSIDCDRMRKGKEYISLKDRICIKSGQCTIPTCEYGNYLKDVGRCPKKQEK